MVAVVAAVVFVVVVVVIVDVVAVLRSRGTCPGQLIGDCANSRDVCMGLVTWGKRKEWAGKRKSRLRRGGYAREPPRA